MTMKARLQIDDEDPEILKKSIVADCKDSSNTTVNSIDCKENNLIIDIEAESLSNLRGTINTYLRLVKVSRKARR